MVGEDEEELGASQQPVVFSRICFEELPDPPAEKLEKAGVWVLRNNFHQIIPQVFEDPGGIAAGHLGREMAGLIGLDGRRLAIMREKPVLA
jgi:hypothetical protein